jgi:tetratricopeptide (TPR) repeat protein
MKPLQVAETLAAIIDHLCERRPIILVCEDIDAFDPASRALCDSLAQAMAGAGVLFLTTSRTRVRLANLPASFARSLVLSPLANEDAAQLLINLNPQFRDRSRLTTSILGKAGGNPLFLEEVASLFVNVRGGDAQAALRLTGENDNFAIPDQVEALIADRLAHLPRDQHRLVQACAVIGHDVSLRLASKLTGIREVELYKRLVKLQSAHLLYETRKYPDPQFTFKHALTRDVAYNTIVPSKRREYHESIVAILESETSDAHDRHLDDLCMHSIHAQAWKKAVVYLQLAAGLAVQRSSYELAEGYLNRALEISRTLADDSENLKAKVDILLSLRGLVGATGKYLEVSAILDEADAVARQLGDPAVQSRVMAHRAHVLNTLGDLGMAVALAERSRETAQALDNRPLFLLSTFFLGQAQFNMGNIAAAEDAFAQNIKLFPHISPPFPTGGLGALTVLTHGTCALTRAFKGDFRVAAQDALDAKRYAQDSGRPYDLSFAAFAEGFVDLHRRQADSAADAFYESIALAERREPGDRDPTPRPQPEPLIAEAGKGAVRAQVGLGHALLLASDLEGAAHWLSQAYAIAGQHNRYMVQTWAGTGLALLYFLKQEDESAARYAEEASAMGLRYRFSGFHVQALRARGLIRAANPATLQDGIGDLRTALSVAAGLGMRTEVAHCHAAFAFSRSPDMAHHIQEAQRLYGILDMASWSEQILKSAECGKRAYC